MNLVTYAIWEIKKYLLEKYRLTKSVFHLSCQLEKCFKIIGIVGICANILEIYQAKDLVNVMT